MQAEMISRIERAENDAFLTLYQAAIDLGTGWSEVDHVRAVWSARDDDPGYSCVLNLADAVDPEVTLGRVEEEARAAGARVLGIDGSPAVLERIPTERLAELGFRAGYQEHMWGRQLSAREQLAKVDGVEIVRVDERDHDLFARVLNLGYEIPEDSARGYVFASTIGHPNWFHYLVTFDDQPGSASVLYLTEGVAQLFVATTVPAYRGRGAQTALIRRRLTDARDFGCDLATSQTVVDNASPRNMARHGFAVLYTRWIFGKHLEPPSADPTGSRYS